MGALDPDQTEARLAGRAPPDHLIGAADRILDDCLNVDAESRLFLAAEPEFEDLAAAIRAGAHARGLAFEAMLVPPEEGENDALISRVEVALERFDRSALICTRRLVRKFRQGFTAIGDSDRRHAHLLGINDAVFRQGLRADFGEIEALGARLAARLGPTSQIEVSSPGGTELVARPDPRAVWHNQSGILRGPGWTNLPSGELATCPKRVDGVFVPDGGVGLTDGSVLDRAAVRRLKIRLEGGVVTAIEGPAETADALSAHLDSGKDGRRVGQISFGTNTDVLATIGLVAQDTKLPGFHLTLSYSAPECTRAPWCGDLLINLLQRQASVSVDGTPVLVNGRYQDF